MVQLNNPIYLSCIDTIVQTQLYEPWFLARRNGPIPEEISRVAGLADNIKLQDNIAQKNERVALWAWGLKSWNDWSRPVFDGDTLSEMKVEKKNKAKDLIEDFMIASNGCVTARFLTGRKTFLHLRRVVRFQKTVGQNRWTGQRMGFRCRKSWFQITFWNTLSFSNTKIRIILRICRLVCLKLLGRANIFLKNPYMGDTRKWCLSAVKDYTHSTAPNRRYPDLVTQRLLTTQLITVSRFLTPCN